MFRYVVLVGNPDDPSDVQALQKARQRMRTWPGDWQWAVDSPGFYVAYLNDQFSRDLAVRLHGHGVILGRIFSMSDSKQFSPADTMRCQSNQESDLILRSKGRSLISRNWGYYVAALRYPETSSTIVLRSPMSPLACFYARFKSLGVFFSTLTDYIALKCELLSINWDSICAQVVGGDYLTHETAINGITHVECGEAVEIVPNGWRTHVYWDPRQFVKDKSLDNFQDATRAIRNAVCHSVDALSHGHENILVSLSGGLDSSIVLGALRHSPRRPALTAVTYYSRGPGDERHYARSMANSVDCPLVEYQRNDRLDLARFRDCNLTVRPVLNFSAPDIEARNAKLAEELSASAIFNGELGDNVFGSALNPGALVDSARLLGLGRSFFHVATDYALLTRQSIWRTLGLAWSESKDIAKCADHSALRGLQRRHGIDGVQSLGLASGYARERCLSFGSRFLHPWLKDARELAPGSDGLLFGLIAVTSPMFHSPFSEANSPPLISPLVSQPLAETALKIPSYLHCSTGNNRAVARAAFADVLPGDVLHRGTGKGGPDLWAKDVIESNAPFLRDYLLAGVLAQRNLIDAPKLEQALSGHMANSTAVISEIMTKLYIEAWIRNISPLCLPYS